MMEITKKKRDEKRDFRGVYEGKLNDSPPLRHTFFLTSPASRGYGKKSRNQEAYLTFNDKRYLDLMRMSFDWFVGKNRLEKPLYDFESKGCRDGLMDKDVNLNQGAESTLSFLISLLTVTDVSYVDMSKPKGV